STAVHSPVIAIALAMAWTLHATLNHARTTMGIPRESAATAVGITSLFDFFAPQAEASIYRDADYMDVIPVLLIHGFPGGASDFAALKRSLSGGALSVTAPDLLGFGRVASPTRTFEELWIDAQADAIAATFGELNVTAARKAVVYGHDYGVMVALALANRRPDYVQSLVLSAGNFFADPPLAPPMRLLGVPGIGSVIEAALFSKPANRWMARSGVKRGTEVPAENTPQELAAIRTIFATALKRRRQIFPDVERIARSITVPVRLVWGVNDPFFPGRMMAKRVAETFPNWKMRLESGVGHFPQIEIPDIVADEIRAAAGL
ncbi:MAG: alpha/beta fold hydrolase, partial [Labrys sp. (in: a-proteobacteria)]